MASRMRRSIISFLRSAFRPDTHPAASPANLRGGPSVDNNGFASGTLSCSPNDGRFGGQAESP